MRVSDEEPDILRFLSTRQIALGATLQVDASMSATGLMTVRHNDDAIEFSAPIATAIHVTTAKA